MIKITEIEGATYSGVLSSNYGEIPQYMETRPQDEIQGTKEATLYASYLKVLPVNIRGRQIEQNLLMLNLYFTPPYVSNSKDYSLENLVAAKISEITDVEYIVISKEDFILQIWIVINKLDREVRDKIYDIEYDILEHFRETYFDFHVVCRDDRDINELFSSNAIMIYRK